MAQARRPRPLMLIIFDGWGYKEDKKGNAVLAARTQTSSPYQSTRLSVETLHITCITLLS